jgi:hypothetical protein
VEPRRKKIPTFDLIFAADHNRILKATPSSPTSRRACSSRSNDACATQGIIDATGLVEFEVGKALLDLNAGFIHRRSQNGACSRRGRARSRGEHRNLGVAFFRPACSRVVA